jgi:hypothetical protein
MHDYMRRRVQLVGYLEKGLLHAMMELPTKTKKIKQIFFSMLRKHRQKYAKMHKTLPDNHIALICFFKQCQNTDQANNVLDWLKKEKTEMASKKMSAENLRKRGSKMTCQDRRRAICTIETIVTIVTATIAATTDTITAIEAIATNAAAMLATSRRTSRTIKATAMVHCGHDGKSNDHRHHDKNQHHFVHNDDGSKRSVSTTRRRSRLASRGSSVRSRSASLSRLVANHHMEEQGTASPHHPKRTHSYSEDDDEGHRQVPTKDGGSIYATFAAPSNKSKKARCRTA